MDPLQIMQVAQSQLSRVSHAEKMMGPSHPGPDVCAGRLLVQRLP